jgi:multicomponent Na+:H+ antiporter subunit E
MTAVGWALALFTFWVVLSGHLDALHLGMGAAAVGLATFATRSLLLLPPDIGPGASRLPGPALVVRLAVYLGWLFGQVVVASVHVAWVVLHPRMPIAPRVVRISARLPHPLARLTLAQSITLTPGTVAMDVEGDEMVIHALTPATARSIEPGPDGTEADMPRRVRRVFEAQTAA